MDEQSKIREARLRRFHIVFCVACESFVAGVILLWLRYELYIARFWSYAFLPGYAILFLVTVALVTILLWLFIDPIAQLKKQKLHRQPSWVFYSLFAVPLAPIVSSIIKLLLFGSFSNIDWVILLATIIIFVFGGGWYKRIVPLNPSDIEKRFAAGSAGLVDDALNFKPSAINAYQGIVKLDNYITVIGLYGGMGFGKSSFARMIVENFDDRKTLYTYISLTETNEAKDFSNLFAERWVEALAARYPKIDATSYLPMMNSILRENGQGFASSVLTALSNINPGILKTKSRFHDRFYVARSPYTSSEIGKLFANIPEIGEDIWIIIVDEIERASFDEVYRLTEVIERFKNEGRSGLPIKLVFILCISREDFESFLKAYDDKDPRAYLLKEFFLKDQKSVTQPLFLPPIDIQILAEFIVKNVKNIRAAEKVDDSVNVDEVYINTISNPSRNFMAKPAEALGYALGLLTEESPRTIERSIGGLRFFYGAFRDRAGIPQGHTMRFSDLLALEYIKLKYPFIIEFFIKTINLLTYDAERNNASAWVVRRELKENKKDLGAWITDVTGHEVSSAEKEPVERLIGLVAYYYHDFLEQEYASKNKYQYFGTTSYPESLRDYLSIVSESVETSYRTSNQIYLQHRKSGDTVKNLKEKELLNYSRFLLDMGSGNANLNIDVLREIAARVLDEKIKLDPRNIGDTVLDEAIYQLAFQIATVAESAATDTDEPPREIKDVFEVLRKILSAEKLNTGAKYIILNSLANDARGSGSEIHFRLNSAFEKLRKYYNEEILKLIRGVLAEADKRYLDGAEIIYEKEENYFYTLYQSWSGSKDNAAELKKIRAAAMRKLENYPDAIKTYWSRYPYQDNWTPATFQAVKNNDPFFPSRDNSGDFYMSMKDLIAVTKKAGINDPDILAKMEFWSKVVDDPNYQKAVALKDDRATLRAVLTRRQFLIPEYEVELSIQAASINFTPQARAAGAAPAMWEIIVKSIGDQAVYLSSYALQTKENPNDLHPLGNVAIPTDGFKIPFIAGIPPEPFNLIIEFEDFAGYKYRSAHQGVFVDAGRQLEFRSEKKKAI